MDLEENLPRLWLARLPRPGPDTHKHARGRLGVVCGGPLNTGAARLAARAGLRIGAGLVRLLCPPDAALIVAGAVEAIMVDAFAGPEDLEALARPLQAVVIGPAAGLTAETEANLARLARTDARLVVDADALSLFQARSPDLFARLKPHDILTPHDGEFERLFPGLFAEGREAAVVEAARRAKAHVLLKGHRTLIASPDGQIRVNANGSPWLATAGSGDVLCGLIGGLMAQGLSTFDAASAAVWLHADAADRFGPGLIAEDLPDLIPAALRALAEIA